MDDDAQSIDVHANRASRKWTRKEQVGRILWAVVQPVFGFSPRPFWGWRRLLLRIFGAKLGANVHIYPSVRISIPWNLEVGNDTAIGARSILYALGPIRIGARVTISQGAHLCAGTHDWRLPTMDLLKPPITIDDNVWICADAFIGPGVVLGKGSIVGARAVVTKNIDSSVIVAGNPAQIIGSKGDDRSPAPSQDHLADGE